MAGGGCTVLEIIIVWVRPGPWTGGLAALITCEGDGFV